MLLGFETNDDAAIYRLSDDIAAVLTLDFFTPIVNDPYEFGCIAAANALSDVFAMGARPLVALNILAINCSLGTDVVADIVRGGSDKVREAGAVVVGGHSIEDDEPKYGLAVFGTVHPDKIIRNEGCHVGDALFYTKRIGTGLMNAALRAGLIDEEGMRPAIDSMMELNLAASEAMQEVDTHAATDVTGFSLVGHLHEMLEASGVSARLRWDDIPRFDEVFSFSCDYCRPGKTFGIIDWAEEFVNQGDIDDEDFDNRMGVLCDPQTSGGLIVCCPKEQAQDFIDAFEKRCERPPSLIGEITNGPAGSIEVVW